MKKSSNETSEQIAFMDWVRLYPTIEPYVIHIANQRRANLAYGAKLKRMGVRAGVSDIFVARPNLAYHGLWIEFKHGNGRLTEHQTLWLDRMAAIGYAAHVVYGCDEAIEVIKHYFGMPHHTVGHMLYKCSNT